MNRRSFRIIEITWKLRIIRENIESTSIHMKKLFSEVQTQIQKWISKFKLSIKQVSFEFSLTIDPDSGFRKKRDKIPMRVKASGLSYIVLFAIRAIVQCLHD